MDDQSVMKWEVISVRIELTAKTGDFAWFSNFISVLILSHQLLWVLTVLSINDVAHMFPPLNALSAGLVCRETFTKIFVLALAQSAFFRLSALDGFKNIYRNATIINEFLLECRVIIKTKTAS